MRSPPSRYHHAVTPLHRHIVPPQACELYLQHRAQLEKADAQLEPRIRVRGVYGGAYHSFVLTQVPPPTLSNPLRRRRPN